MQMGVSCVLGESPSNRQLPGLWCTSALLEFHVISVLDLSRSDAASESFIKTNTLLQKGQF